jgi:hypothetical protein
MESCREENCPPGAEKCPVLRRALLLLGLSLLGASPAGIAADSLPRTPPGETRTLDDATESVLVQRVRWSVQVTPARNGREGAEQCVNLTPADFAIEENGRPVRVTAVDRETGVTVFAFLIDTSESLADNLRVIQDGARTLASRLVGQDKVLVASFAEKLTVRTTPTRDPAEVEKAFAPVQPGSRTALYDALRDLTEQLEPIHGRKVIILVTDGEDTSSRNLSVRPILERFARSRDLRLCTVFFRNVDEVRFSAPLRILSQASAGRFEWVSGASELPGAFEAIRDWFDKEIVLTYEPSRLVPPAEPRKQKPAHVRVKIKLREGLPCKVKELVSERLVFARTLAAPGQERGGAEGSDRRSGR